MCIIAYSLGQIYNHKVIEEIFIYGTCIVGDLILGDPIGIGTILATIMLGPCGSMFNDLLKTHYDRLMENEEGHDISM